MHTENTANQSLHDHCIVVKSIYILIMEILHGKQCLDCFFKSVLQVLSKEMYPMQQWSEKLTSLKKMQELLFKPCFYILCE